MKRNSLIIADTQEEIEAEASTVLEPQPVKVRALYGFPIAGHVVIKSEDGRFKLCDPISWRRALRFEMPAGEFEALSEPVRFDLAQDLLEEIWAAGIYRSDLLNVEALKHAIRFFDVKLEDVINIIAGVK